MTTITQSTRERSLYFFLIIITTIWSCLRVVTKSIDAQISRVATMVAFPAICLIIRQVDALSTATLVCEIALLVALPTVIVIVHQVDALVSVAHRVVGTTALSCCPRVYAVPCHEETAQPLRGTKDRWWMIIIIIILIFGSERFCATLNLCSVEHHS